MTNWVYDITLRCGEHRWFLCAQESPSISSESKSSQRRAVARGTRALATTESQSPRKPQSGRNESESFSSVAAFVNDRVAVELVRVVSAVEGILASVLFEFRALIPSIKRRKMTFLGSGLADQRFGCLTNTERRKERT